MQTIISGNNDQFSEYGYMDHTRKNGSILEKLVTLEIMRQTLKNWSRIRNRSQKEKWATLGKSRNTSKNGSHRKCLLIGR